MYQFNTIENEAINNRSTLFSYAVWSQYLKPGVNITNSEYAYTLEDWTEFLPFHSNGNGNTDTRSNIINMKWANGIQTCEC